REAGDAWDIVLALHPQDAAALAGRDRARAQARAAAASRVQRARLAHLRGNVDEAVKLYLEALAQVPDDADAIAALRAIEAARATRRAESRHPSGEPTEPEMEVRR
ncbi:MAG: hypothetical protein KGN16_25435, partial [Burkholderiales bacterium]|nr:hypothetical protein [Burkholderiales bacterium]